MTQEEIQDRDVMDFQASFCPFGYRDIAVAIDNGKQAGKSIDRIVEMVTDWASDTGTRIDEVDPVFCVFDALYQEARTDIEVATGKDISNDEPFRNINIAANYMCTSIDGRDEDMKELKKIIASMKKDEMSKSVQWLQNQL